MQAFITGTSVYECTSFEHFDFVLQCGAKQLPDAV